MLEPLICCNSQPAVCAPNAQAAISLGATALRARTVQQQQQTHNNRLISRARAMLSCTCGTLINRSMGRVCGVADGTRPIRRVWRPPSNARCQRVSRKVRARDNSCSLAPQVTVVLAAVSWPCTRDDQCQRVHARVSNERQIFIRRAHAHRRKGGSGGRRRRRRRRAVSLVSFFICSVRAQACDHQRNGRNRLIARIQ